jgi:hypothetical protein
VTRSAPLDLVILVPGKDERETFDALLSSRRASLRIASIAYEIRVHPRRDAGCFLEAADVLQLYIRRARHALVVLDHEGSGRESDSADDVARDLHKRLADSGWGQRAEVLVLEPELENWVWSDSPHVDRVAGWEGQNPSLRDWLRSEGNWPRGASKPLRPKECFEKALEKVRTPRSSSLYRQLAEKVSLERCTDPAFLRFRELLARWFPAGTPQQEF